MRVLFYFLVLFSSLIGSIDFEVEQQVRIHLVPLHAQRRTTLRRHAFDAHFPHQTLNSLPIYDNSLILKEIHHLTRATIRTLQMFLVHHPHPMQILLGFQNGIVIHVAAVKSKQATLFTHAELCVIKVDPGPSFTHRLRPLFF